MESKGVQEVSVMGSRGEKCVLRACLKEQYHVHTGGRDKLSFTDGRDKLFQDGYTGTSIRRRSSASGAKF